MLELQRQPQIVRVEERNKGRGSRSDPSIARRAETGVVLAQQDDPRVKGLDVGELFGAPVVDNDCRPSRIRRRFRVLEQIRQIANRLFAAFRNAPLRHQPNALRRVRQSANQIFC